LTPRQAILPILAALASSVLATIAMVVGAGSRASPLRIVPGVVAPIAAAWTIAAPTVLG
jgi:hypothetical protein